MRNKIHQKSCTIKFVNPRTANKFIAENHRQGVSKAYGTRYDIGLYYKDKLLVGLATFCDARTIEKKRKYQQELLRLTFKKGLTVYEGASALIHYYEKSVQPKSFFTYQTTSGKASDVYKLSGMKLVGYKTTKPMLVKNGYTYQSALKEHAEKGTKYLYLNQQLINLGPDELLGTSLGEHYNQFGERQTNSWLFIHKCGYHIEHVPGDRIYEWINPNYIKQKNDLNSNVDDIHNPKYAKALDLYLRGYKNIDIKKETGITLRAITMAAKRANITYSQKDIIKYQTEYIRKHYNKKEIIRAYKIIHASIKDLRKERHAKRIKMLGCVFGPYAPVMENLLGKQEFDNLRNTNWKRKQEVTMLEKYGKKNFFQSKKTNVNEAKTTIAYFKRSQTLFAHMSDKHFFLTRNKRAVNTNLKRYGTEYPIQTKQIAKKAVKHRQETMLEKYGVANSVESDELRNKIFKSRKRNHTMNSSEPEETLYLMLIKQFGKNDVIRQYKDNERYPYHVDFYIKSKDLFIELNGDMSHMEHWFNAKDKNDQATLNKLKKAIAKNTDKSNSRYATCIKTWTDRDVQKRNIAKMNNLNYLVFWDGNRHIYNGKYVPTLSDAHAWFNDGCPDPHNWRPENTY